MTSDTPPSAAVGGARSATSASLAGESVCAREIDFERLVTQYLPAVLRIARRVMGSEDLAWDAAQESLLCLWQAKIRPAEPRPWLAKTVMNRCLHLKRTMRRRCHYEEQARACGATATHPGRPDHWLENRRLASVLERALAALPPGQRTVLVLREVHGLDYPAIARQLGLALGTVRSRLHRARADLRATLVGPVPAAAVVARASRAGHSDDHRSPESTWRARRGDHRHQLGRPGEETMQVPTCLPFPAPLHAERRGTSRLS